MPRGPYHTRPLAVPRPAIPFNLQTMNRPNIVAAPAIPPKPTSTNQRKRTNEKSNAKAKTESSTSSSKKALTVNPSYVSETNKASKAPTENDGKLMSPKVPKGSKAEQVSTAFPHHVSNEAVTSQSKATTKGGKVSNAPATGKEKQGDKKIKKVFRALLFTFKSSSQNSEIVYAF